MDLLFLIVVVGFFAGAIAYVEGCERLWRHDSRILARRHGCRRDNRLPLLRPSESREIL